VEIPGKADTGDHGHQFVIHLPSLHPHHQYAHLLIGIDQFVFDAVEEGVRLQHAAVNHLYGTLKIVKTVLEFPLIGAKDALVFACKCISEVVLKEAGGTDNNRLGAEMLQHLFQLGQGLRPEGTLQEKLSELGVLGDNLVPVFVLLAKKVEQVIVEQEFKKDIRTDVV